MLTPLDISFLFLLGEVKQEGGGVFREGTPYQRRGSLQLWQFLVALLDDPGNAHFIAWTGRGMEFKLIEPEEVYLKPSFLLNEKVYFLSETGTFCVQTAGVEGVVLQRLIDKMG